MNRKTIILVTASAVSAAILASCAAESKMASAPQDNGGAGYYYETTSAAYDSVMSDEAGWEYSAGEKPWESAAEAERQYTPSDSARKLIKNVSMELETKDFDAFRAALDARIAACGGYIQDSAQYGGYGGSRRNRYATVKARIPAARLDEFCGGIGEIANVVSKNENASDVTVAYYDMASHVKALRQEYDTLLKILEKCTEVKDVISVQSRITEVLYQIESYQTQLNNYDNLVAYSTVTLTVNEVERETVIEEQTVGERMAEGLARTWESIRENLQDFAVDFVVNLPYILIGALLCALPVILICLLVRRVKRRNNDR